MNDDDKAKYLANIYHMVLADGSVDRVEERVFDVVQKEARERYAEFKRGL